MGFKELAKQLALHVAAMAGDAYFQAHPEWYEIVKDANQCLDSVSKPTIRLFREGDSWFADFENDKEVKRTMGTTIIPTPYRASAKAGDVVNEIAYLNKNHVVYVAGGR